MPGVPKSGRSSDGREMHYSVGMVASKIFDGKRKYLLIDRNVEPLGYAGIAGHVDEGEYPEQALEREVREESGLELSGCELILEEEVLWNRCSKGVGAHYWYLYRCDVEGDLSFNRREVRSIDWYSDDEIKRMASGNELEPVWEYWLERLGII